MVGGSGAVAAAATGAPARTPSGLEGPAISPPNRPGPAVTGAAVVERARGWINARPVVPYNQLHRFVSPSDFFGDRTGDDPVAGWREDCSGFVSYAWGLAAPGYVTSTLPGVSRPIAWSALQPGDALLIPGVHVALFAGWDDAAHTTYTLWDEANTTDGTVVRAGVTLTNSYWSTYTPVRYTALSQRQQAAVGDYNGDGQSDPALWRPSNGRWYLHGAAADTTFGIGGDIPVPADYNGDGRTDVAVWRPAIGRWYLHGAATDSTFGISGDIPVPADYNGDGRTDVAVWRPAIGRWYLHGAATDTSFGLSGDIPVPADYNGDGRTDVAVWRPSTGRWYLNGAAADTTYGTAGDVPVPADYNGDGRTDLAVWRPSTGVWYLNGAAPALGYGRAGDVPVPGNVDAAPASDVVIWRPADGTWWFTGKRASFAYGTAGDFPVSSLLLTGPVLRQYGLA